MVIQQISTDCKKYLIDTTPYSIQESCIEKITKYYGGKYLFEWNNTLIFYNPQPDISQGHSNYYGISVLRGNCVICNAQDIVKDAVIHCIRLKDHWVYSHHCHDLIAGDDGLIDGGFEYIRVMCNSEQIPDIKSFKIIDGNFEMVLDKSDN